MRVVTYLSLSGSGKEVGWGGRLLTFSAFRMGANSRLGAYSNKIGILKVCFKYNLTSKYYSDQISFHLLRTKLS